MVSANNYKWENYIEDELINQMLSSSTQNIIHINCKYTRMKHRSQLMHIDN